MPGLNRRGPTNKGPMTGRKMGRCNSENKGKTDDEILESRASSVQSDNDIVRGQGLGSGFDKGKGLGRGLRRRFRGNA